MKQSNEFIIYVDDLTDGADWFKTYRREMNGIKTQNFIDIKSNPFYDPSQMESEEGHFYFPTVIECMPMGDVSDQHQLELARKIVRIISNSGARYWIAGPFEDEDL